MIPRLRASRFTYRFIIDKASSFSFPPRSRRAIGVLDSALTFFLDIVVVVVAFGCLGMLAPAPDNAFLSAPPPPDTTSLLGGRCMLD